MKKALQIILHLVGFPLLTALVIIFSLNMFKLSISYGVMAFIGLIITVVMAGIYYLVFFLMAKSGKKSIFKQTIVSIIVASICLGGLWIVIDVALPDLLDDATSGTIFYEDLADDYDARAEVNRELLDEFIKRNYENGNLKSQKLSAYLEEGYRNDEVKELIKTNFQSIDKDGYVTFVGPWIDMANDDRMTIPVLIHLVINEREFAEVAFLAREPGEDGEMLDDPVKWSVLDMLGEPMEFDLGPDGMGLIPDNMVNAIKNLLQGSINTILSSVSDAIEDENVLGSPITIELAEGTVLTLTPSNYDRGVLDYQSMGWLDSNGLIIMITSLFSIRKLFLIFAGVLIITTYAIGLLREEEQKQGGNSPKGKKANKQDDEQENKAEFDPNNLTTDYYKPYDPSYVVVKQRDRLNMDKIMRQLLYDAENGITKRYDSSVFMD